MTKVKICGITNLEDALLSAKFGADALGFNFYPKSPRYISPEKAREIIEQLPMEVLKVGVFVNESLEKISEIASIAKLDAIQLHGEETPEFVREVKARTNLEIIKAFRVSPGFKPEYVLQYEVDSILLDAYSPKEHGGTGETFDWEIAKKVQEIFPKMYLAGGLNLQNVGWSVSCVAPFYVDVCSGIESESGKKNKVKTINFLKISKYEYKNTPAKNIYDFCWAFHPNLTGFRLRYEKLNNLAICLDSFRAGLLYASTKSNDFDLKKFDSRFDKNRTCKVSGSVDLLLPENHIAFQDYVRQKYEFNKKSNDWAEIIINDTGADNLEALYTFFALLEEYRVDYDKV